MMANESKLLIDIAVLLSQLAFFMTLLCATLNIYYYLTIVTSYLSAKATNRFSFRFVGYKGTH